MVYLQIKVKERSPVMEIIINEINKTINYFKAHLQEGTPQLIYIVGDGAKLMGLTEFMSTRLGIPTEIGNPLKNIEVSKKIIKEVEQMSGIGFSVAVGLGMKTE